MSEDPESLALQVLRDMRAEIGDLRADLRADIQSRRVDVASDLMAA